MRSPAVAGSFYPRSPEALRRQLDELFKGVGKVDEVQARGAVIPHAGYVYSGPVAAEVYARLPRRDTYVILGPNHTGLGAPVAMSTQTWETPLGSVEVDADLAKAMAGTIVDQDDTAHLREHSIEVQLPFLQYRFSGFKILPITMRLQDEKTAVEVGTALGQAIKGLGRSCTIIASSDFTHYEPQEVARSTDAKLLEAVLNMDIPELYHRVYGLNATACGYGPISATITTSRILGAKTAKLLRYATSGDTSGDYSQVVGYSAVVFT